MARTTTTPQQSRENSGSDDDFDRDAAPVAPLPRQLLQPSRELTTKINMAFLNFGYETMTMVSLAKACEFSRPALYQYFQNKEQAFRFSTRAINIKAIDGAFARGEKLMRERRPPTDVFAEVTFARYALMRTPDLQSPHRVELNAAAARKCSDILIEVSLMFRDRLTELLARQFSTGLMTPREGVATTEIAQTLADGARGVDQSLPAPAPEELLARHRWMVRAVLYGCMTETTRAGGR